MFRLIFKSRSIINESIIKNQINFKVNRFNSSNQHPEVNYIQGQYAKKGSQVREYFYFISDEGYLFLDDTLHKNFTSAFKDKEFLKFFFDRLQLNNTGRYVQSFTWLSRCGYERNYIRTFDVPIVYTHIINDLISYNYGGELLSTEFEPENIIQCPLSGRVYYPTIEKYGSIGLVTSKLAIELSKHFIFDKKDQMIHNLAKDQLFDEPIAIEWNEKTYELSKLLRPLLIKRNLKFD